MERKKIRYIAAGMLSLTLVLSSAAATTLSGTVTFADQAGQPDNSALPAVEYNAGLPAGLTALWSGWLLHTESYGTPMSVFPAADLSGNDAEVNFSTPVIVSSFDVKDTAHGSVLSVMGYRAGIKVWHYDGVDDNTWHTVTVGAGVEIDTLVVEGKWNHLDNITVEVDEEDPLPSSDIVVSLQGVTPSMDELELTWPGTIGYWHQLQSSTDLSSNAWQNIGPTITGIGDTNAVIVDPGADPVQFFRVRTETIPADEVNAETGVAINGLPTPPAGYKWIPIPAYTDEFNGTALDTSKWQDRHPYWSGRAPSEHLPENVSVAAGKLRLKNSVIRDPSTVADPNSDVWVGAACITSVNPAAFYGYYETKMKASSVCMTSAFWFQEGPPQPNGDSEIDVVEQLGVSYNNPHKEYWMQMNTHYYPNGWPTDQSTHTHWTMPTRAREEYHVYGVWWKDATTLWMYHNGVKVAEMTPAGPFVDPQYMFFDTEVFTWEGLPTVANLNDDSKNSMYVDWVRGWELVPE